MGLLRRDPDRPGALERGRIRRRLRRQSQVREALLLDLGALVFELHRQGRREPELLQAKAAELMVVDEEVRALDEALGTGSGVLRLTAAGIAGTCSQCSAIMPIDARYCASCGAPAQVALDPGTGDEAPPVQAADETPPLPPQQEEPGPAIGEEPVGEAWEYEESEYYEPEYEEPEYEEAGYHEPEYEEYEEPAGRRPLWRRRDG